MTHSALLLRLLSAGAAALLLAACAGTATKPANTAGTAGADHAVLKTRAQQRWDWLIAHQAAKAWDYLTPGYRATISRKDYAAHMDHPATQWTAAKINKVVCEQPHKCHVYVIVNYKVRLPGMGAGGPLTTFAPLNETWLQLHNQWYYLPR